MEQRDFRGYGRHQQNRIAALRGIGIVHELPVRALRHEIGADDAAQRHEGDPLLRRLQPGMDGRTGGVTHDDSARAQGCVEPSRGAVFTQRDGCGFDFRDTSGADEHIGLEPRSRHGHEPQTADAPAQQRADHGHGAAAVIRRDREMRAVGDACAEIGDVESRGTSHGIPSCPLGRCHRNRIIQAKQDSLSVKRADQPVPKALTQAQPARL